MNCESVIREISNYIDGDLDAAKKQEVEKHLAGCEECAIVMHQTKLTVTIFGDSQPMELPLEVHSRLHDTLRRKIHRPAN